jgi:hypothetical protein
VEVYHATDAQAQAAENYWTPERMRNAIPVDATFAAGEGTIIGVLGGDHQGGDPKKDGDASFATRLDKDFEKFWRSNSK